MIEKLNKVEHIEHGKTVKCRSGHVILESIRRLVSSKYLNKKYELANITKTTITNKRHSEVPQLSPKRDQGTQTEQIDKSEPPASPALFIPDRPIVSFTHREKIRNRPIARLTPRTGNMKKSQRPVSSDSDFVSDTSQSEIDRYVNIRKAIVRRTRHLPYRVL